MKMRLLKRPLSFLLALLMALLMIPLDDQTIQAEASTPAPQAPVAAVEPASDAPDAPDDVVWHYPQDAIDWYYPEAQLSAVTYTTETDLYSDEFKQYLLEQFKSCPSQINIAAFNIPYSEEKVDELTFLIWKNMPELFHVYGLGVSHTTTQITRIYATYETGFATPEDYLPKLNAMVAAADDLLYGIEGNSALTDAEKVLLLHERLCLWNEYDYDNYYAGTIPRTSYMAYGALALRVSVCEGYAKAYMYLLNRIGIPNQYCLSRALNHAWNIVYLDGVPYHVDTTWDDYTGVGKVMRTDFLVSTQTLIDGGHDATDFDSTPVDTRYEDAYWRDGYAAFQLVGDEIYYVDYGTSTIKRASDHSVVYQGSQFVWYTCLSTNGTELLFSKRDGVYAYNLTTEVARKIYTPTQLTARGRLFGFNYENGYLVCEIDNQTEENIIERVPYDYESVRPTGTIAAANQVASSQTVTLTLADNTKVIGYYWGTSSTYTDNRYTRVAGTSDTQTVDAPGTYYLTVKDQFGNVSETTAVTFYQTTLDAGLGTVTPAIILTAEGKSLTLPTPTRDYYRFAGWSLSTDGVNPVTTITPTGNAAYYAVWTATPEAIASIAVYTVPTQSSYYIGDSFDPSGMVLQITYQDSSTQLVSSGYTVSGYSSQIAGIKTVTVTYTGKTATFNVTVNTPYVIMSHAAKTILVGETETLTAETIPGGFAVTWTSNNGAVAVNNGAIQGKMAGSATLTAAFTYNGIEYRGTCQVTVVKATVAKPAKPQLASPGTATTVQLAAQTGYEYKCGDGDWQTSSVFTGLNPATAYTFYQRVAETETAYASPASDGLTVTTDKATLSKPGTPTVADKTDTTITLTPISGHEYRCGNGPWQTSNHFTGLAAGTAYTFYQRIAETATAYASPMSDGHTEKTQKFMPVKPQKPTFHSKTDTTVTLMTVPGYEYKMDQGDWQAGGTFTGLAPNSNHQFYQRIGETETAYASPVSDALTVTTDKQTVAQPGRPTYVSATHQTVTLTQVAGYEYRCGSGAWQTSPVFTGLSPATAYMFYQRLAETETAYASPVSEGLAVTTDKETPAKPGKPTLSGKTQTSVTLTAHTGYVYKCGDGPWQSSPVFTGLNPGTAYTFYQQVAATETAYASLSSDGLTVTTDVKPVIPSSTTSSIYTVTGTVISKIPAGTTVNTLLGGLSAGPYCTVYQGTSPVSGATPVGTGMTVRILDGQTVLATYHVVVTGDTNGDGDITITDMLAIKAHILKKTLLTGVRLQAADTSGDGDVTITDFIQVKAKILGKGDIVAR